MQTPLQTDITVKVAVVSDEAGLPMVEVQKMAQNRPTNNPTNISAIPTNSSAFRCALLLLTCCTCSIQLCVSFFRITIVGLAAKRADTAVGLFAVREGGPERGNATAVAALVASESERSDALLCRGDGR